MSLSVRLTRNFRPAADSAAFALHVEFTAARGITVLFGPSGAGKSLTLNCIAGFEKPDSGRVMLGDRILFDAEARVNLRPRDRHCGYVFQSHALFPHMTVRENLMFVAERHPRLERHRLVTEMLERFGLTEMAGRKPANLSGGQNQRCSIARTLITSPRALLLDEPAAGLDVSLRSELSDVLKQVRDNLDIPLLLITHDADDAMMLADHVLVYSNGEIVQRGSADSIRTHPASADVARMFGPTNVLDAEILALDPGRNSSRVRINGTELNARYLPGHFRGDRIRSCMARAVRTAWSFVWNECWRAPTSLNSASHRNSLSSRRATIGRSSAMDASGTSNSLRIRCGRWERRDPLRHHRQCSVCLRRGFRSGTRKGALGRGAYAAYVGHSSRGCAGGPRACERSRGYRDCL
jgi:molybdate transport system ATP-binding protein